MTAKKTTKSEAKPVRLKIERLFDASPKTLWSYWVDPEKFTKWFNPAPGKDLVVHEYDVRVGGQVKFDMPQPDGNRNPQEGVFHVVKPNRQLVSGSPDKSFLIEVTFAAAGKKTRMTVTVTGVPKEFHEGATKGWNAGFDKLAGLLRGPASKAFTIERTFKASPARLWDLWTTKKGVEAWWGPEGFITKVEALDPRVGGAFEYQMTAVGSEQVAALEGMGLPLVNHARNVFTDVASERRLAFKTRVDFIPGVLPYEVVMEVEFHRVRAGTKIVVTSSRMHNEQFEGLSKQGEMEQLGKLGRLLGEVSAPSPGHAPVALALPSEHEILISRVFDATPDRVFRAHLDPKALAEWWGPEEYANTVDRWEPRAGGAWRIVQKAPDGTEHPFRGIFKEIVPSKRLTWTFEYEPLAGHIATQTVTFEPQRGGKTKLSVRVLFANQEDRDGMLASGMEGGMRQGYERLDDLLARRA